MKCSPFAAFLLAIAAGAFLAGCERPPLDYPAPGLEGPYRLDSGDELRVVVYDQPSLTNLYEVDQSGQVSLPRSPGPGMVLNRHSRLPVSGTSEVTACGVQMMSSRDLPNVKITGGA